MTAAPTSVQLVPTYHVSVFECATDNVPAAHTVTLDDLVNLLTGPIPDRPRPPGVDEKAHKETFTAWSPARWSPAATRSKAGVIEVCALVADVDDGTPIETALGRLPGCMAIVHTSYSHTAEHPKYRIVVPLARPIPAALYPRAWAWLAKAFDCMDRACSDTSRLYFLPIDRPAFTSSVRPGPLLDMDWTELPEPPVRRARAPAGVDPSTWAGPSVTDYKPEIVDLAVQRWRERLSARCLAIGGMTTGRRTEIVHAAYGLAGWTWLHPDLMSELRTALATAAVACRWPGDAEPLIERHTENGASAARGIGGRDELVSYIELHPDLPQLVVHGGRSYVRRADGSYTAPLVADAAMAALRDETPDADRIALLTRGGKPASHRDLVLNIGKAAERVEYSYPDADGRVPRAWDESTHTLRTTRAARPVVTAEYDPQVQAWLDAGLSESPERVRDAVLDWCATSGPEHLDRPTACLYVEGSHGGGKSMFATATASVWRRAPCTMDAALSRFNGDLLYTPIVHADEDCGDLDASGSGKFRVLISERSHVIEGKGQERVQLVSAVRGVITANGPGALRMTGDLNMASIDAIAERVLHVRWSDAAAQYLRRIGGSDYTTARGWVTAADGGPGRVARHFAYLGQTRRVRPGSRFLVGGIRTRWHDRFVLTGGPVTGIGPVDS